MANKIKLIYSATSASIGNDGNDKNLSPYAFSKAKNLEMLENLKNWFNFKYEILYFYNVYGPRQISQGKMATVIGIFEDQYKKNKPLTVVKPAINQEDYTYRRYYLCVFICMEKNKCRHYSISNKKSHTILQVAKMFNQQIKFYLAEKVNDMHQHLLDMNLSNKVYKIFGKIQLKNYVISFINSTY